MRDISSLNQSASQADTIAPVIFVALEFDSGTVRLHSSLGDLTFGGHTYTGTGGMGGIDSAVEDSELGRTTLNMTLAGLPLSLTSIILDEQYQGRTATIYLGYLDTTTRALVDDPTILFRGNMDTASVKQGKELSLTLSVETRFAAWDRPLVRRYNNADQQGRFPGDLGLEFVEQSTDKQISWGQKS